MLYSPHSSADVVCRPSNEKISRSASLIGLLLSLTAAAGLTFIGAIKRQDIKKISLSGNIAPQVPPSEELRSMNVSQVVCLPVLTNLQLPA